MTKQLEWSAPHGRANSQAWQLLTGAHCCILKPERAGKATEIHWIPNYPITNLSQFDIHTLSHSFCTFFAFCVCWKQHCPFDLNSAVMHFRKPNFILSLFYFSTQLHIAGPFCKLDKTSESLSLGCFCNLKPKKATEIHCYDLSIEIYQNALFIQI